MTQEHERVVYRPATGMDLLQEVHAQMVEQGLDGVQERGEDTVVQAGGILDRARLLVGGIDLLVTTTRTSGLPTR